RRLDGRLVGGVPGAVTGHVERLPVDDIARVGQVARVVPAVVLRNDPAVLSTVVWVAAGLPWQVDVRRRGVRGAGGQRERAVAGEGGPPVVAVGPADGARADLGLVAVEVGRCSRRGGPVRPGDGPGDRAAAAAAVANAAAAAAVTAAAARRERSHRQDQGREN